MIRLRRKRTRKMLVGLLVAALVGLFLIYVWPTEWTYYSEDRVNRAGHYTIQLRKNRFSGNVQRQAGSDWIPDIEVD